MHVAARLHKDDAEIGEWDLDKLGRWVAFFDSEWDPARHDDRRTGTLAAVVANVMTTKGDFEITDFMPKPTVTSEPTAAEVEFELERRVLKAGGIVTRKKDV